MNASIIPRNQDEIAALCRKYRVEKWDLFGSAATNQFNAQTSDVDLIVDFAKEPERILYRFVALADDLEHLLQRPIDLLTGRSIGSPRFRARVDENRVSIYGRRSDRAAA